MTNESQSPLDPGATPELAALLAAAQRPASVDPEGAKRALGAFRAARDEGAYEAALRRRPRRRDDWRRASSRRGLRSLRVTVGGFVAAVTLGGVAVAAGSGVIPTPFGGGSDSRDPERPVRSASATPGHRDGDGTRGRPGATPGAGRSTGEPDGERSDEALCEAHRKAQRGGKADEAPAFERLEAVAGSASAVPAYCDRLLEEPSPGEVRGSPGSNGPASTPALPDPGNGNEDGGGGGGGNVDEDGGASGNANGSGAANGGAAGNANGGAAGNAAANGSGNGAAHRNGSSSGAANEGVHSEGAATTDGDGAVPGNPEAKANGGRGEPSAR